jgi:hypothetical protein
MFNHYKATFPVRKVRSLLIAVVLVIVMMSCLDSDDQNTVEPVALSYVSVYHASPDAPAIDIIVDNRKVNAYPFEYTDYSGYLNFYTGNRNFRINSFNASNALIDTTLNLLDGNAYSLFVIDRLSSLETLLVKDSAAAPGANKAVVRLVNLSPDAPALNLSVSGQSTDLFSATGFRTATDFKALDADRYDFDVKTSDGQVIVSARDIGLRPGNFYTVVIRGFVNPPAGSNNALSIEVL